MIHRSLLFSMVVALAGCPSISRREQESIQIMFNDIADTLIGKSQEYDGGRAVACAPAAISGLGLSCAATNHVAGGNVIEREYNGTSEVKGNLSWAEKLGLGVGGIDRAIIQARIAPVESVFHQHSGETGSFSCPTTFIERIDQVRLTAFGYAAASLNVGLTDKQIFAQLSASGSSYVTTTGRFCKDVDHGQPLKCSTESGVERQEVRPVETPANPVPYPPSGRP